MKLDGIELKGLCLDTTSEYEQAHQISTEPVKKGKNIIWEIQGAEGLCGTWHIQILLESSALTTNLSLLYLGNGEVCWNMDRILKKGKALLNNPTSRLEGHTTNNKDTQIVFDSPEDGQAVVTFTGVWRK